MTEIIATTGQNAGQVSVAKTIQTMAVGETWTLDPEQVRLENVRVSCAKVHATSELRFTVLGPCYDNSNIRIIRIK